MNNFEMYYPCDYVFGKDVELEAGKRASQFGKKVLLHYDGGDFLEKSGLLGRVRDSLKAAGMEVYELGGVRPNPVLSLMRKGIELVKKEGIDVVVGLGGGSTMDSSKMICMGAAYDGDVLDLKPFGACKKMLPLIVIPTMSGTGSEISICTMVCNDEVEPEEKFGILSFAIIPTVTLMNPELQYTLPKKQIAAGCMDIISQVMNTYFTETTGTFLTDRMDEAVMETVVKYAPIALENPTDYDARSQIALAASIGAYFMIGYDRNGRESGHTLENPVTTTHHLAHGQGLALVTPAIMKYTYKRDIPRFARWANTVMGVPVDTFDLEKTAVEGIKRFEDFIKYRLGLATRFEELGIGSDEDIERYVELVRKGSWSGFPLQGGSPYELSEEDVRAIYKLAQK